MDRGATFGHARPLTVLVQPEAGRMNEGIPEPRSFIHDVKKLIYSMFF